MYPDNFAPDPALPDFSSDSSFEHEYELIRELGRGGMAVVYLVRERTTGEERAVKVIQTRFADDRDAVARFDREARLVADLQHPNIVATHAVRRIDGVGFGLVMDHVRGRTLKQLLAGGEPIAFDTAARILDDIASALGFAHSRGIVHRDVKPENIFVEEATGRALLADFGIARSMQGETQLTLAGAAIGTPTYMAPEQIDGAGVDARSDLYSLGLVGWETLTGRRPWDGESLYNVIYRQKHDHLVAIDALRPDTPKRLVVAIEGLLEKSPSERWQSAEEFRQQLSSPEEPVRRTKRDVAPAPDATVVVPVPYTKRPPSRLRRVAPLAASIALLLSGTLVFALAPSWMPGVRHTSSAGGSVPPHSARTATAGLASSGAAGTSASAASGSAIPAADSTFSVSDSSIGGTPEPLLPAPPPRATVPPLTPANGAATSAAAIAAISPSTLPGTAAAAAPHAAADSPAATPPRTLAPTTSSRGTVLGDDLLPPPPSVRPAGAHTGSELLLAAGGTHTCLIGSAGAAYCWGANNDGQLGTGATQTHTTPTAVAGSARFASIAPGLSHTCGLNARGVALCWGNNESGQLGDGSHASRDTPKRVSFARPMTSIVSGAGFSCGLTGSGQAQCWGAGARGQLGDAEMVERAQPSTVATEARFSSLAAGWNHVCGLTDNGAAYCWGANDAGQLGDGSRADRAAPVAVASPVHFIALTAGTSHTCGLTATHAIYCWGGNSYGQLGDGSHSAHATPTEIASPARYIAVSAGGVHTCAVTVNREAVCWGRNTYGQLGDGNVAPQSTPTPVAGAHAFATIKAFGSHTCGVSTTGDLFCWGYNLDGELGDGTREHRLRPTYIDTPGN
ncbi:MAG: protein kinase [Gemmatimonadota bacterium]|nr:protein kinase [Gemmatimonadota bacterium]